MNLSFLFSPMQSDLSAKLDNLKLLPIIFVQVFYVFIHPLKCSKQPILPMLHLQDLFVHGPTVLNEFISFYLLGVTSNLLLFFISIEPEAMWSTVIRGRNRSK